jgi:hypothetical protein
VTAVRIKDSALGPDWHIAAIHIDYETRDAKVERMEPPAEVDGLPVTESHEDGTVIEVERPVEGPEPEPEPADEPEPVEA